MKRLNLAIGMIILAFPAQALMGQVSSFPYSQDFTSNPLGGTDWSASKIGTTSTNWVHSTTDGNTGGCLKLTGYVGAIGEESYLDLALNTSGKTFTSGETYSYDIFRENGALGDVTVVVQQNSSGSFADIGSSFTVQSLTATTWTTKSVTLPSSMENKSNVKIRIKISNAGVTAFNNLRYDNASVSGGALPVQMVSFAAVVNGFDVNLRWSTATEVNSYGFEIERRNARTGEQRWSMAAFVAGSGTSTSSRTYEYLDPNLSSDGYAYRIKQVDNDGTFQYYGNAEVEVGLAAKEFKLESNYPNPFNPATTIQFTVAEAEKATLNVYNVLGQHVTTLFDGEAQAGRIQQVKFDASRLPSGLYFAKLEASKQQMMRKMVLMK